ncbi:hypothetical protein [Bradyrhizobium sp. LHD-71]|uniref:hypothetical protein n=1 Tax=Bradyrhizobium sp. LHD-71 TaxID=3072141 RepID=UPI00280DC1A1|nr:hypothetical protein [Bradyrhizobium sp. LHD-71]MDQ8728874.1 hypothetical protein [Bradyrhizobium sp. LHD-71]
MNKIFGSVGTTVALPTHLHNDVQLGRGRDGEHHACGKRFVGRDPSRNSDDGQRAIDDLGCAGITEATPTYFTIFPIDLALHGAATEFRVACIHLGPQHDRRFKISPLCKAASDAKQAHSLSFFAVLQRFSALIRSDAMTMQSL